MVYRNDMLCTYLYKLCQSLRGAFERTAPRDKRSSDANWYRGMCIIILYTCRCSTCAHILQDRPTSTIKSRYRVDAISLTWTCKFVGQFFTSTLFAPNNNDRLAVLTSFGITCTIIAWYWRITTAIRLYLQQLNNTIIVALSVIYFRERRKKKNFTQYDVKLRARYATEPVSIVNRSAPAFSCTATCWTKKHWNLCTQFNYVKSNFSKSLTVKQTENYEH